MRLQFAAAAHVRFSRSPADGRLPDPAWRSSSSRRRRSAALRVGVQRSRPGAARAALWLPTRRSTGVWAALRRLIWRFSGPCAA